MPSPAAGLATGLDADNPETTWRQFGLTNI
jgi:hypothetical protein